ncbi:hypothetical protein [Saccharibacillus brassicae]|uniref:Uncharacterized protein n=1 Tax=Saccharibacillus brassicae TaxID=2583377 RepID=A0A4Y6UVD1_SACBS|nr:hypothetical protein [Saccharibacillus brassicae]QDH20301.1 hypothetical protein FFV09_05145 [Saccharibacillus brassicae]
MDENNCREDVICAQKAFLRGIVVLRTLFWKRARCAGFKPSPILDNVRYAVIWTERLGMWEITATEHLFRPENQESRLLDGNNCREDVIFAQKAFLRGIVVLRTLFWKKGTVCRLQAFGHPK